MINRMGVELSAAEMKITHDLNDTFNAFRKRSRCDAKFAKNNNQKEFQFYLLSK